MAHSREDSFRAALLMIGAPTPRYHRRRGSNPDRLTSMHDRMLFVDKAAQFAEQYFGEIAWHGSFLTYWLDGYEKWYTHCVTNKENTSEE